MKLLASAPTSVVKTDEDQEAEAEDVAAEDVLRVVAARDQRDDLVVDEADRTHQTR